MNVIFCSVTELEKALSAGATVIGVNNRNLRTFALDMGTTAAVVARAASLAEEASRSRVEPLLRPPVVISLSGVKEPSDLASSVLDCAAAASEAGISRSPCLGACLRGFLVGEALMRASDPKAMASISLVMCFWEQCGVGLGESCMIIPF